MLRKKCCAISDLHGVFVPIKRDIDYLFIAGDICPLNIQWSSGLCMDWLKEEFIPWCTNIKGHVIFIGGNHDKFLENKEYMMDDWLEMICPNKITYLADNFYEDENIIVYGTPLCKQFGRWSFMKSQKWLENFWKDVEFPKSDKYKIILSHDAPYGTSDVLLQSGCPWADGSHIGNNALRHLIENTEPNLNLHGHLHSTNHDSEYLGNTEVRCVSILDEDYKVEYMPTYFCI